jgi:pyruvate dehydrogenase E2 component (dihydrolipoamide acetyltransferase)
MPALGVAQEKGTLINWLKSEGETVTKGEPLMEVETDKATVEIEAPASGILRNVTAGPGDEVPVGNKIAVIAAAGEAEVEPPPPRQPVNQSTPEQDGTGEDRAAPAGAATELAEPAPAQPHRPRRILSSPAARRIAREQGVDLSALRGTGPEGAIVAEDVLRSGPSHATAVSPAGTKQILQLTPMRRIVGERMAKSKQAAPHFYLSMDVDMSGIVRGRNALKEKREAAVPSINDYILAACARALKDFPSVNASFSSEGVEHYAEINIGMAVALEEGLVVPVIRNADRLSLAELAKQTRELAEKAQNKKLFPLDYEGGTFTVSNLGMFGVDAFIAIINPPQCAILAVGQIAPRVVVHGEGIAVRSLMTMTLSADHRVIDGAIGARFLQALKRLLENPV